MSFEQLWAIANEVATIREAERARPLMACPNDGEPLKQGPDGTLYCPFDGFRADGWEDQWAGL